MQTRCALQASLRPTTAGTLYLFENQSSSPASCLNENRFLVRSCVCVSTAADGCRMQNRVLSSVDYNDSEEEDVEVDFEVRRTRLFSLAQQLAAVFQVASFPVVIAIHN